MNFHIITLFPEMFDSYLSESILARAIKEKKIKVNFYNPRDFAPIDKNKKIIKEEIGALGVFRKRIDDKPYGGGPGMVVQALPVIKAIEKALSKSYGKNKKRKVKIIFLSPGGKQFTNEYATEIAKKLTDIVIVSGRYEGIDARIKKIFRTEDVSVGPFVLTGGELPAMIMMDTISRQIDGVLGNFSSLEESRISSHDVYTRPETIVYKKKKYSVPKVLLSGHQKKIEEWKKSNK